jgi:hypothetical protein
LTLSKNEQQTFSFALQNQDPLKIAKTTSTAKTVLYDFNRGIKEIKFDKDPKLSIAYQIENAHSLRFYAQKLEKKDTLFITALIKDSVNRDYKIPLKIKFRELTTKEKPSKSTMPLSILPTSGKYLSPKDSLLIILPKPVVAWDSKRIQFITGPDEHVLLPDEAYSWNDVSNRLRIDRAYLPLREKFDLSIEKSRKVTTLTITHPKFLQTIEQFTYKGMDRKIGSERKFGKAKGYYQVYAGDKQKRRDIQDHSLDSPFDPEHVYHQASLSVSINLGLANSP